MIVSSLHSCPPSGQFLFVCAQWRHHTPCDLLFIKLAWDAQLVNVKCSCTNCIAFPKQHLHSQGVFPLATGELWKETLPLLMKWLWHWMCLALEQTRKFNTIMPFFPLFLRNDLGKLGHFWKFSSILDPSYNWLKSTASFILAWGSV